MHNQFLRLFLFYAWFPVVTGNIKNLSMVNTLMYSEFDLTLLPFCTLVIPQSLDIFNQKMRKIAKCLQSTLDTHYAYFIFYHTARKDLGSLLPARRGQAVAHALSEVLRV